MNKIKRFFITQKSKATTFRIKKLESMVDSLKEKFDKSSSKLAKYKVLALEKKNDKAFKKEFNKVQKEALKASEQYNKCLTNIEKLRLEEKYYNLDLEGKLHELHSDIMRYKNNSLSFWLCIFAIILNVAMFLIIYKCVNCTPNVQLGIDLLINIIFMLTVFLISEKTKTYDKKGGYYAVGLGVLEVLRIFWIPLFYYLKFVEYSKLADKGSYTGIIGLDTASFMSCVILMVAAGLCLISAGIVCLLEERRLKEHLQNLKGGK